MAALLEIKDLSLDYGAVRALDGVSLTIREDEIVAVLGANGAGKTSLLKAISCLKKPTSGSILFKGEDISQVPPYRLAAHGIAHVPEGRHVFATLSVRENLTLGQYGVRGARDKTRQAGMVDRVYDLFPILKERRGQLAGTLSGGEQQMLAIGRALVSNPSLLLLDEPSLGLAPIIVQEIFALIRKIHEEEKVAILLVEQNARKALRAASRAYILELGKIVIEGESSAASGRSAGPGGLPGRQELQLNGKAASRRPEACCSSRLTSPAPACYTLLEARERRKEMCAMGSMPASIDGIAGMKVTVMGLGLNGGGPGQRALLLRPRRRGDRDRPEGRDHPRPLDRGALGLRRPLCPRQA